MSCAWCNTDLPITDKPNLRIKYPNGSLSEPITVCHDCSGQLEAIGQSEDGMIIVEGIDAQDILDVFPPDVDIPAAS